MTGGQTTPPPPSPRSLTPSCVQTRYIMSTSRKNYKHENLPSPNEGGNLELLTGNTLVSMKDGREMNFIRLPSTTDGIEKHKFSLGFEGWSMAAHPPTNVLAVSEVPKTGWYVTSEWLLNPRRIMLRSLHTYSFPEIHILKMDTGEKHPAVKGKPDGSQFLPKLSGMHGHHISISQTNVATIFYGPGSKGSSMENDRLFIWNWRNGNMLYASFSSPASLSGCELLTLPLEIDQYTLSGHSYRQ